MDHIEDAQARLTEIAKRRDQALDGASRGRHRGWDAAGALAMIAGFAALDLPAPSALQLGLFAVALVAALTCFTRAGRRGKVVMHQSQMTGRFWAVLGGFALASGVLAFAGIWLVNRIDIPLRFTLVGVLLAVLIAVTEPLYRALLRRTAA
ncbi:membrane protein implicated in regulation of membrane protease activity [Thermocatellispora tengchongensis]|uniref:Membrane protein implicated in regulation of membrane protease activity n=1 Tax=Thermocatellispora tengchongensis TaxID=1073253 RepID=A0A840PIW5_9ACTN|nr:hypothetical protein [Thermocatellispora tengchongensis]MBB5138816.1 membrane protein implicated in regulation of membrane protease activity [Thermocatellispora tengchongensis]